MKDFIKISSEFDLDILYEVHDADDINKGIKLGLNVFGVNNRDLTSFEVNHDNVFNLAKGLSDNHILISESGIESRKDIMNLYASKRDRPNACVWGTWLSGSVTLKRVINFTNPTLVFWTQMSVTKGIKKMLFWRLTG